MSTTVFVKQEREGALCCPLNSSAVQFQLLYHLSRSCCYFVLAHCAKACTELLPSAKGLRVYTIQEFPCGALLRTIPSPFVLI
jgi:hypothetical protein